MTIVARRRIILSSILCLTYFGFVSAQGIFEQSLNKSPNQNSTDLKISGFIKGSSFLHLSGDDYYSTASYGSAGLKISSSLGNYGKAYADIRFRAGQQFGENLAPLDVREAWAAFYLKRFSFTLGKQIIAWGRTDGFNPTNYFGAQNYFFLSANRDDQKIGSFMLKSIWNPIDPVKLEVLLVPGYQSSIYRFDLVGLPDYVQVNNLIKPARMLTDGSLAIKADFRGRILEGSVSYYRGFNHLPGLQLTELASPPFNPFYISLAMAPYKQQCVGLDGALVIQKTILRAEIAYNMPFSKNSVLKSLPQNELNIVWGIERKLGPIHIIAQYIGKYIPDFISPEAIPELNLELLQDPSTWPYLEGMLGQQIAFYNRILFEQQNERSHAAIIHPSVDLFHQQLSIGLSALYNFTTEEYMVFPAITFTPADRLSIEVGYQYYDGPENSRFFWIKNLFSGPYTELRISF
ncbi:MAG: hypothetical protein J7L96_01810 [Bacteroidales bacterium]|nr:hypothetical protein [Bacteroidales bacterium]